MSETELAIFGKITGRQGLPVSVRQLWIMAGRRSGKSLISAFLGIFYAAFKDWSAVIVKGEIPRVVVVCPDRKQGHVCFSYAKGFVEGIPMLRRQVRRITKESIIFKNGVHLEIATASYRTIRGFTIVCVIVDEAAFLRDEDSANPFGELLTAVRPSMATTNGILIVISMPYSRTGEFWNAHQKYWGQENPSVLFVKGPTQLFNPSVPDEVIQEAFAEDPAAAASEYGSLEDGIQFRSDVESFVPSEVAEACKIPGRFELPRVSGIQYQGFVDPSGGSSDSFTLGIAHRAVRYLGGNL